MRRSFQLVLLLGVGVSAVTCGPPPPVPTGTINATWGCREDNSDPAHPRPACTGGLWTYNNTATQTGVAMAGQVLTCYIDDASGLATAHVNFSLGVGSGNNPTNGLVACAGANGGMPSTDSFVTAYFGGPTIMGVRPPSCTVTLRSLDRDGDAYTVSGSLRCADVVDDLVPGRLRYITGIPNGGGGTPTMDPMRADFVFTRCQVRAGALSRCN